MDGVVVSWGAGVFSFGASGAIMGGAASLDAGAFSFGAGGFFSGRGDVASVVAIALTLLRFRDGVSDVLVSTAVDAGANGNGIFGRRNACRCKTLDLVVRFVVPAIVAW
jgi:hypothetical protein